MKRINCLFVILGYLISILAIILMPTTYVYIEIIIITILFSIGIKRFRKKFELLRLTILNILVTLFNIIAVVLRYRETIDLYNMDFRLFVEYIIPFLITLIIQKTNTESLQQN